MYWCLLVFFSVLGIDIGEKITKVSIATDEKAMHLALGYNSKRFTPSCFAIWNNSNNPTEVFHYNWDYGDIAKTKCFKNVKYCTCGNMIHDSSLLFLNRIHILSLSIRRIIDCVMDAESVNENPLVVFSLTPEIGVIDKSFLEIACSIAGINYVQFIDSNVAAAYHYCLERSELFKNSEKVVAFLDFGSSGTRFSIFKFSGYNNSFGFTELYFESTQNFSGNGVDNVIFLKAIQLLGNPKLNDREEFILMNQVQKAKESLTINSIAELKIEIGGKIFGFNITNDDLWSFCKLNMTHIESMIQNGYQMANISQVDSIEVIGGSSRLSFLSSFLMDSLNIDRIGHSVNAESSPSMGAGYFAAERSMKKAMKYVQKKFLVKRDIFIKSGSSIQQVFSKNDYEDSVPFIEMDIEPYQTVIIYNDKNEIESEFTLAGLLTKNRVVFEILINNYGQAVPYKILSQSNPNQTYSIINMKQKYNSSDPTLIAYLTNYNELISSNEQQLSIAKSINAFEEYLLQMKSYIENCPYLSHENLIILKHEYIKYNDWFSLISDITSLSDIENMLTEMHNNTNGIIQKAINQKDRDKSIEGLKKTISRAQEILSSGLVEPGMLENLKKVYHKLTQQIDDLDSYQTNEIVKMRMELKEIIIPIKNEIRIRKKKT